MKVRDYAELVVMAAIWGAGFLFMRMGAGEFGAVALALIRTLGGALVMMPLVLLRREGLALRRHWRPVMVMALSNSALPFALFAYATAHLGAGISAVFNATTPMWVAVITWLWIGDRLSWQRLLGLLFGTAGVTWLVFEQGRLAPTGAVAGWAVAAALGGTGLYAFAAVYARVRMAGVPAMVAAGGSQLGAGLVLLLPGLWWWPAQSPSASSWAAALCLAVLCTGVVYAMYFRLIARIGATNTVSVAYLVAAFGVLWGVIFLDEVVTPAMLGACAVVLAGVALTTGLLERRAAVRLAGPPSTGTERA